MFLRLFLLFTLVPLLELAVLLRLGSLLGLVPTLLLVVATGVAGAWLARREGLRSWQAVQRELAGGRFPGEELLHGVLILVAGVVLVTPGVLTDALGIVLLVRPARRRIIAGLRSHFAPRVEARGAAWGPGGSRVFFWGAASGDEERGAEGETRELEDGAIWERRERPGPGGAPGAGRDGPEARRERPRRVIEL